MSFPHWPPTSFKEAEAQFKKYFEKENEHRRYLVICWWSFINKFAIMEPWTASERQQRIGMEKRKSDNSNRGT